MPEQTKKHRAEECEVAYLGLPPLSAQDGSLQENNLLGGQASVAEGCGQERKREGDYQRLNMRWFKNKTKLKQAFTTSFSTFKSFRNDVSNSYFSIIYCCFQAGLQDKCVQLVWVITRGVFLTSIKIVKWLLVTGHASHSYLTARGERLTSVGPTSPLLSFLPPLSFMGEQIACKEAEQRLREHLPLLWTCISCFSFPSSVPPDVILHPMHASRSRVLRKDNL